MGDGEGGRKRGLKGRNGDGQHGVCNYKRRDQREKEGNGAQDSNTLYAEKRGGKRQKRSAQCLSKNKWQKEE